MADEWTVSTKKKHSSNAATREAREARAVARLSRDLIELQQSSFPGIAAAPVGEDLFRWTASLCPVEGPRTPFHLVLTFDTLYPSAAPRVQLCTPIPHRAYLGAHTPLCCDLLDPQISHGSQFSGWSSAFGVASLLLQLQSFLFDPELIEPGLNGVADMAAAVELARAHAITECKHGSVLEFPTPEQLCLNSTRRVVKKPAIRKVLFQRQPTTQPAPPTQALAMNAQAPAVNANTSGELAHTAQVFVPPSKKAREQQTPKPAAPEPQPWITVKTKTKHRKAMPTQAPNPPIVASQNIFDKLPPKPTAAACEHPLSQPPLTKAHKKNQRRRLRTHALKQQLAAAPAEVSTPEPAPKSQDTQTAKRHKPETTNQVLESECKVGAVERCGLLDVPARVFVEHIVLPELTASQVGCLAQSCTRLRAMSECGELWKDLFQHHCPTSELTAAGLEDWKHAYCCQVTSVMSDLKCFHSKAGFDEAILGVPVVSTTNPRTHRMDYIDSTMDVLSYDAFHIDKVRSTVWKEQFDHFLPMYICQEHFERALPVLEKSLASLCPHLAYRGRFNREMVLEVLPTMMVTQMVLIADKGKHCSERVLEGYCMLHRLLLACVECYGLQRQVEDRIRKFMSCESSRTKQACPALGHMYALLSVSDTYTWRQVHHVLMQESFDRAALWVCKTNNQLAHINDPKLCTLSDDEILQAWLEADTVRLRISMYSVLFLQCIARPKDAPLAAVELSYDELYGRPSATQRKLLQQGCDKVLGVASWPEFFQCSWLTVPTKEYVLSMLKSALKNSGRKKYHTPGMDFSRVQASGVSKILLKGESYSCGSSNLRRVELQEAWGWSGAGGTIYLDASCLLFSDSGEFLEVIDYANRHSRSSKDAVRHSGDVIDDLRREGKHTISLDLHKLQSKVATAYFTFTGFTTDLSEISQPSMSFHDADNAVELCRYDLEKSCKDNHQTAITMCKLHRDSPGGEWSVTAIGHVGAGRATDYDPIIRNIANHKL